MQRYTILLKRIVYSINKQVRVPFCLPRVSSRTWCMLVLPITCLVQRIAHLGVIDGQRPGLLNGHALGITKLAHKTIRASMNMRAYKTMLCHEVYHTGLTPVVALLWPLYDNYSTIKHSFFRGQDKVVPELTPYGAVLLYASLCSRVPTVKPLA